MATIGTGADKPQFIPEQVHRAFVEEFFRNRVAFAIAHITLIGADGNPIAFGETRTFETSEERKDGFTYENE
jgi:CTP:molybdopterin cytidylyltransferase MocA